MRKTLKTITELASAICFNKECAEEKALAIQEKCAAALAKPPRNCDKFSNEDEACKAFIDWYNTKYDLNGDKLNKVSVCALLHNVDDILLSYITWLFADAEGGEE